jgi:hypothetical protein
MRPPLLRCLDLICNAQRRVSTRPSHAPASSQHVECTCSLIPIIPKPSRRGPTDVGFLQRQRRGRADLPCLVVPLASSANPPAPACTSRPTQPTQPTPWWGQGLGLGRPRCSKSIYISVLLHSCRHPPVATSHPSSPQSAQQQPWRPPRGRRQHPFNTLQPPQRTRLHKSSHPAHRLPTAAAQSPAAVLPSFPCHLQAAGR